MASYFNLTLDTTAPAGLTMQINDGATHTVITAVTLTIGTSDTDTTGYQMKIWGISTAANEAAATWETYAGTKSVTLAETDGLKTVSIKIRDTVGNETAAVNASITLDTKVPEVTITGPDKSRISKVPSYDESAFGFISDVEFIEYVVKVVPSISSLHTAGTQIPMTGGSTNMSGTGDFPKDTAINSIIKGVDFESASSGDGVKIVKVFVLSKTTGKWSA